MEEVKIPGYVHLFKISIGGLISFGEIQNSVYRFTASQGMSTSLAGLKKFLNLIDNRDLVELREKSSSKDLTTSKVHGSFVQLTKDVDIFIASEDLADVDKPTEAHFICYADTYMDSMDEFKNIIAFAALS